MKKGARYFVNTETPPEMASSLDDGVVPLFIMFL
jgi:hypothetical protein